MCIRWNSGAFWRHTKESQSVLFLFHFFSPFLFPLVRELAFTSALFLLLSQKVYPGKKVYYSVIDFGILSSRLWNNIPLDY